MHCAAWLIRAAWERRISPWRYASSASQMDRSCMIGENRHCVPQRDCECKRLITSTIRFRGSQRLKAGRCRPRTWLRRQQFRRRLPRVMRDSVLYLFAVLCYTPRVLITYEPREFCTNFVQPNRHCGLFGPSGQTANQQVTCYQSSDAFRSRLAPPF